MSYNFFTIFSVLFISHIIYEILEQILKFFYEKVYIVRKKRKDQDSSLSGFYKLINIIKFDVAIHLNGERVDMEMARFQIQEKSGCSGERIPVDTWNSLTLIQRIRRIAIGESPWLSALQPTPFVS